MWVVVAGFSNHDLGRELWIDVEGTCTVGTFRTLRAIWPPGQHEIDESHDAHLDGRMFPPGGDNGLPEQALMADVVRVSNGPPRWQGDGGVWLEG